MLNQLFFYSIIKHLCRSNVSNELLVATVAYLEAGFALRVC